jgi:hypothetical protein
MKMMKRIVCLLLLCGVFLLHMPAWAQDKDDAFVLIPEAEGDYGQDVKDLGQK